MDPELELSDFCSSVLPLTHFFFSLKRWGKFNQLLPLLSSFISKKPIFKDPTGLANLEGKKTLYNRYSPKRLSRKPVCLVTQSCLTLCNPMDCSPPGSSVYVILQARILEWGLHSLLQGIFMTQVLNAGLLHCRQILPWSEPPGKPLRKPNT